MSTLTIEPTAETVPEAPETFADVAERLGDIPLRRILWLSRPATEEDVVRYCETRTLVELVDGILVEKAMGYRESFVAAMIVMLMNMFVSSRKLGLVAGPDAIHRLAPGTIRLPDVSYVSWPRLLATGAHTMKVGPLAPDLAVEVLSESNTGKEIDRKRREFFAAGTELIWVINPRSQTAEVYNDPSRPDFMIPVSATGILYGGTVLPGFELSMEKLFADLEPPASLPGTSSA